MSSQFLVAARELKLPGDGRKWNRLRNALIWGPPGDGCIDELIEVVDAALDNVQHEGGDDRLRDALIKLDEKVDTGRWREG